jgi:hypothetical protein
MRRTTFGAALVIAAALVCIAWRSAADGSRREVPARSSEDSMKSSVQAFDCPAGLVSARRGGSDPDRYSVPSEAARAAMTDLVARLVTGGAAVRASVGSAAAALGFSIDDVPEWPGTVLLRELPAERHGGGAYVLRLARTSTLIVQAPHTFFDEGTLPLGCELFTRASAAAFFIDTAHRYKSAEVDENGDHPADVAHAPDSLFQAATEGLLRAMRNVTLVQVHGFASRESGADVVLSAGTKRPKADSLARAQRALTPLSLGRIARFPDESSELGATTNVQGTLVRGRGGRFLHIEMSSGVRKNLLANAELRARFFEALTRSLAGP